MWQTEFEDNVQLHFSVCTISLASCPEWRVRTGMNNAGKGAWLSSRKTNHTHLYPTSGHTGKETKLKEARNIHGVWLVARLQYLCLWFILQ